MTRGKQIARARYQRTASVSYRLLVRLCQHAGTAPWDELIRTIPTGTQDRAGTCSVRLQDLKRAGLAQMRSTRRWEATLAGRAHVAAVEQRFAAQAQPTQRAHRLRTGTIRHLLLSAAGDEPLTEKQLWDDRAGITPLGLTLEPAGQTVYCTLWRLAEQGLLRRTGLTTSTTFVITDAGRAALAQAGPALGRPGPRVNHHHRLQGVYRAYTRLSPRQAAAALGLSLGSARAVLRTLTRAGHLRTDKGPQDRCAHYAPAVQG